MCNLNHYSVYFLVYFLFIDIIIVIILFCIYLCFPQQFYLFDLLLLLDFFFEVVFREVLWNLCFLFFFPFPSLLSGNFLFFLSFFLLLKTSFVLFLKCLSDAFLSLSLHSDLLCSRPLFHFSPTVALSLSNSHSSTRCT
jgi:hypothetical protein